jgi:membrane protein YqaA with SNARE-associated domain
VLGSLLGATLLYFIGYKIINLKQILQNVKSNLVANVKSNVSSEITNKIKTEKKNLYNLFFLTKQNDTKPPTNNVVENI